MSHLQQRSFLLTEERGDQQEQGKHYTKVLIKRQATSRQSHGELQIQNIHSLLSQTCSQHLSSKDHG